MPDIRIEHATILTVDADFKIIDKGWIAVEADRIVAIGSMAENIPPAASEVVDATGCLVLPGLINAHTHLPMSLFRGLADDLPLFEWLQDHIFPAESAFITPETVRPATLLSCAEMLLSGTTTCCDGYFLESDVARAVCDSGMRAVLGQGVIDHPAPGVPDPSRNIEAARSFLSACEHLSSRIRPSLFCHSPYTCSEETLLRTKALCRETGVRFQIHAAETKWEYEHLKETTGATPIGYLDRLGLLDPDTLLVHAIWVDETDIERIHRSGASVVHTAQSAMKLASGIAPIERYIALGIPTALGTDGSASNNTMDMFREMDITAKLHKIANWDPTVLNSRTVIEMATIQAAKAIGLEREIGSIEVGKKADLVILDAAKPHLAPLYHPESQVVYAARGADVRDTMVDGNWLVRNGKCIAFDLEAVQAEVRRIADEIRRKGPEGHR
uniref:5-methylthioadenosine/S-adenosylhomocysteine deaminase n=1 Tax=Desulfatirhabdium butyrativorans TaxID=340467 RepID=A0A7C4W7L8_9BACT